MALGAITNLVADPEEGASRAIKIRVFDIVGDSSYPAGGSAITAAQLGLSAILALVALAPSGGVLPIWDPVNQKLKAFWTGAAVSTALAEVTATTNLSGNTFRAIALGY